MTTMKASDVGRNLIVGPSNSGKTTLLKHCVSGHTRMIVFDPEREFAGYKGFATVTDPRKLMPAIGRNMSAFKIRFEPQDTSELQEALNWVSEACLIAQERFLNKKRAPTLQLVVDELSKSFPLTGPKEHRKFFSEICMRGRRRFIQVWGCTQSISTVGMDFRDNLSSVKALKLVGPRNRMALRELTDIGPEELSQLQPYEYWDVDFVKHARSKKKVPKPK